LVDNLTDENFIIFCSKAYDDSSALSDEEFFDDLSRLKNIRKLLNRYKTTGEINERLILNHLIILSNVFSRDILVKIVWLKLYDFLPIIKPFMIALGLLPVVVYKVNGKDYLTDDVEMDESIIKILRKIPS